MPKVKYQLHKILLEGLNEKFAGVLLQAGDTFLLCKRKPGAGSLANYWTVPSGHIEAGELPKNAAIREFYEETKIKIMSVKELERFPSSYNRKGPFTLFHAKMSTKTTPRLNHEHTAHGWFTKRNLPKPIPKEIVKYIEKLS